MVIISKRLETTSDQLSMINQQIIERDQYNLQRKINQNQSIHHRRR
ncbi:hypothetical protein [Columbia Basin potato purple top phytoplasma]|nr:hypothetical protein [Columbia Basin potato purple top phytoplasma]